MALRTPVDQEVTLNLPPRMGSVAGLVRRPSGARFLLVLAHGAGAGMRYHFLEALAAALAEAGVATLRYQFPYMERGIRRPDGPQALQATVRAAVNAGGLLVPGLPVFAGGKSMGSRMTSQAQAERPLHGVQGLVFFGFPLHPSGMPATERADHLARVYLPMLFHQGTRDRMADPDLLVPALGRLAGPRASINLVEKADHDFALPRQAGIEAVEVCRQLAGHTAGWMAEVIR
ncbi:MAG TPA: alpha/beta family hydrolase [Gemmatimonadales bacterium]|nr:alpha/beta family hydrolase [Gemmatimonadales bacterium]